MTTNWLNTYQVSYEYWEVDPDSNLNKRRLRSVDSCEVLRDAEDETLGGASMELSDPVGAEIWMRVYLLVTQHRKTERYCLGTCMGTAPRMKTDGKRNIYPLELYTPLKELADDGPPDGYAIGEGANAVVAATMALRRFHVRVSDCNLSPVLPKQVVALNDTWLSFGRKILEAVDMELAIDEWGIVSFAPIRDASALCPVMTLSDDEFSIIEDDAEIDLGWGDIPNVVRVRITNADSTLISEVEAVNDDPSSPVSTASRGRIKSVTVENPEGVTKETAKDWAKKHLKELSVAKRRVSFSHGFCGLRIGDCVRLHKTRSNLDVMVKITRQSIRCETNLIVDAEGVFSEEVWRG